MKECLAILLALVVVVSYSRRTTNKPMEVMPKSAPFQYNYQSKSSNQAEKIKDIEEEIERLEIQIKQQKSYEGRAEDIERLRRYKEVLDLMKSKEYSNPLEWPDFEGQEFLPYATPEDCAKYKNPFRLLQSDKK